MFIRFLVLQILKAVYMKEMITFYLSQLNMGSLLVSNIKLRPTGCGRYNKGATETN